MLKKIMHIGNLSETKQRVISNLYWSLASKVLSMISALVVGIFVARYLGPEQYGLMNYVVSFVSVFTILATFGFDNIEIREEAKDLDKKDVIIGTTFILRLFLSLLCYLIIVGIAFVNETDSKTFTLISLYAISVLLTPFDVIRNHFTAIVRNEYVSKVTIARIIWSCAIKGLLLLFNASLIFFVASLVLDIIFGVQGYLVAYKRIVGSLRSWSFSMPIAKFMLEQSFPLLLSGAAAYIFLRIDQVMIGNLISKEAVGYFSVASKFVEILVFIPNILISTICPILIKYRNESEELYIKQSKLFLDITLWSSFLCAILVAIGSPCLIKYTFGDKYLSAIPILQILAFKVVGVSLNVVSGQLLIIEGKQKYFVLRSLAGCFVCILFNYLIIPFWGITGVAIIAIVTQLVSGWLIHALIPMYRDMFKIQNASIICGWMSLFQIKQILKRK